MKSHQNQVTMKIATWISRSLGDETQQLRVAAWEAAHEMTGQWRAWHRHRVQEIHFPQNVQMENGADLNILGQALNDGWLHWSGFLEIWMQHAYEPMNIEELINIENKPLGLLNWWKAKGRFMVMVSKVEHLLNPEVPVDGALNVQKSPRLGKELLNTWP